VKNVLIHLGHISAEEGWQAMQHLVEDCAQAPPVHSSVVRLFTKDLRSQVLRGTTEGGCGLLRLYTFLTKPKVCQNHMSLAIQKDILWFQVPVNDVEGVQVANGTGHLRSIEPGPGLQEPALPLQVEEELGRRQ
jgi:hypothetical protein